MRKLMNVILVIALLLGLQTSAFAYTSGYAGISDYGGCPYGNRAGAQYVSNLQDAISSVCTKSFMLTDASANKYVFQSAWSNSVDFFAFSGHGESKSLYSTAHFRAVGNEATNHSTHTSSILEKTDARTTEIRLGGTLKYATFYSCNFLTNGGSTEKQSEIFKMFEGARLVMGFASTMYLDSREGTRYGSRLVDSSYTIENAFIYGAQRYQVQRPGGDVVARVVGYNAAKNDKLTTPSYVIGSSLWYKNNNNRYSILSTTTIPHTGETLWW